jgi:hypothetical protein
MRMMIHEIDVVRLQAFDFYGTRKLRILYRKG